MLTYLGQNGTGPNLIAHVKINDQNIRLILFPSGDLAFGYIKYPFGQEPPTIKTSFEHGRHERFILRTYESVRPCIMRLIASNRKLCPKKEPALKLALFY